MPEFTPGPAASLSIGGDAPQSPFIPRAPADTAPPSRLTGGSYDPEGGFEGHARIPARSDTSLMSRRDGVAQPALFGAGPLTFSRNGSYILGRSAEMSDTVDLGGAIGVTTVGAAIANEWISEAPGGGFERNAAAGSQEDLASEGTQRSDQPDTTGQDQDQPSPFTSDLAENVVGQLQAFEGWDSAVSTVVDGRDLSIGDIARELKVSDDQAQQAIQISHDAFRSQFNEHVAGFGVDGNHLANWVAQHAPSEVREMHHRAIKAHTGTSRSLKGYQPVVGEYLAAMAEAFPEGLVKANPDHLRLADDRRTVLVNLPRMGETDLRTAARQGWLFR